MMSFFGDEKPGAKRGGPIKSTVTVKRTIVRAPPPAPSSSAKGSSSSSLTPRRPAPKSVSRLSTPSRAGPSGSASSPKPSLKRKTSTPSRVQSESESESDSGLDPLPKRARHGNGAGINGSGREYALRNAGGGYGLWDLRPAAGQDGKGIREGRQGEGWRGFVSSEDVLRGRVGGWGSKVVGENEALEKYVAYFPQEGFDKASVPTVRLAYPAKGCFETFVLLAPPPGSREYSPILELRNALKTILEHYIPPSHSAIFGRFPDSTDLDLPSLSSLAPLAPASGLSSPLPSSGPGTPSSEAPPTVPHETIADALRKALAPNRRDGPGLLRAMERFNAAMADLQGGPLQDFMVQRPGLAWEDWKGLVDFVHDQGYSRVVGPYSQELEHHPKHPDEVAKAISGKEDAYGELRHNFVSKIIEQTGLGPNSVFVDLGSGVGNCVMQVALQAGSASYGFELLPVPAHCARLQLDEIRRRWAMWGLQGSAKVDVTEGDFRTASDIGQRLREADVVLVNNEVFPPSLNVDLTNMFLDLKEGAKIVSLKPFVPETFKMNESNCDSFAAICKLTQHTYYKDWVSWKGDSGVYYLQEIDRGPRIKFEERMMGRRRR